ncbi:MAG: TPM domain-containing protein [Allobaculum sp.]
MKKFWTFAILLPVLSLLVIPLQVMAATVRVVDDAELFTSSEVAELEEMADQIAQEYDTNILIVTTYERGYSDMYARDYIEDYGERYYPDGYIAYCIDMADRSYWVDGYGPDVLKIFSQSNTDAIADDAADYLSDYEFAGSAKAFLRGVDRRYAKATKKYGPFTNIIINRGAYIATSIIGGILAILVAFLMTTSKVRRHKDKTEKVRADEYSDPLQLERKNDQLIRTYQTRVPRPKNNGGGGFSGGGGSAGHVGSGGHF